MERRRKEFTFSWNYVDAIITVDILPDIWVNHQKEILIQARKQN